MWVCLSFVSKCALTILGLVYPCRPPCGFCCTFACLPRPSSPYPYPRQRFVDLHISPLVSKANGGRVRVLLRGEDLFRFLYRLSPYLFEVAEWYSSAASPQELLENTHVLNVPELALLLEHAGLIAPHKVWV